MRTSSLLIMAIVLGLLCSAWWILPRPLDAKNVGSRLSTTPEVELVHLPQGRPLQQVDRLASSGATVEVGAPLVVISRPRKLEAYQKLADANTSQALQGALKQLAELEEVEQLPAFTDLKEALTAARSSKPATAGMPTAQRELLEAERMGLEDAATALLLKITQQPNDAALQAKSKELQRKLAGISEHLSGHTHAREDVAVDASSWLSPKQRLLDQWPLVRDTLYAPRGGTYYIGAGSTVDTIRTLENSLSVQDSSAKRYVLSVGGYPQLLATATRTDTITPETKIGAQALEVRWQH